MKEAIEKAAADYGGTVELKIDRLYSSFKVEAEAPLIQTLKEVFAAMGIEPAIQASGGGSDTNHFNNNGIPAVNLSVGMEKVHTSEEFIRIDDLVTAGQMVVEIIRAHA
jgi:tripeptide aminopeptidase